MTVCYLAPQIYVRPMSKIHPLHIDSLLTVLCERLNFRKDRIPDGHSSFFKDKYLEVIVGSQTIVRNNGTNLCVIDSVSPKHSQGTDTDKVKRNISSSREPSLSSVGHPVFSTPLSPPRPGFNFIYLYIHVFNPYLGMFFINFF